MNEPQVCQSTGLSPEVCDCGNPHECRSCGGSLDDDPFDPTPPCACDDD